MTLPELKTEIQKYQYLEDDKIIDVALASVIATRLQIGDPLWMIIVGPSSSGKTQILRPLTIANKGFMHAVDDLTENTFLSAVKIKEGGDASFLTRVGPLGMLAISDLTGIFSKPAEAKGAILGQLRMIYDGEMTKHTGMSAVPIHWKGHIGLLAGSTPALYQAFSEMASMGERFMYYRMKKYDEHKAGRLALDRTKASTKLNEELAYLYESYVKDVVVSTKVIGELSDATKERIIEAAIVAERIRVTARFDWKGEQMVSIPVPAMPMRTALQLSTLMKALVIMNGAEREEDIQTIEWCAWSLANDERRACLIILGAVPEGVYMNTSTLGDKTGLPTGTVRTILQTLSAVGVVERNGDGDGLMWRISNEEYRLFIKRVEHITQDIGAEYRQVSSEESTEHNQALDYELEHGFTPSQKD